MHAMDKLKQRVHNAVSYKKNLGLLQTKIQVLMDETTEVQHHLINGPNDGRNEVQQWLAEVDEILKEANGSLEDGTNVACRCLLSAFCGPTSSWEVGKILSDINKMLEKRESLDLPYNLCGLSYCKNLHTRENQLQDILEALMDIRINLIGIHGMIGVGKTALVEELVRRAKNDQLFDDVLMVQVSQSSDIKIIQTQIANKIGLQLSKDDDEETVAHNLQTALEKKIVERGRENDLQPVKQSRILVILDGLWHVIDLIKVGIPCGMEGKACCKVVLISRNANVCKEMGSEKVFLVECLNMDEAKILLQERLGDNIESLEITFERYQYMENVILMKCRGLPLLINSLACSLRSMSLSNWEIMEDQMKMHTLLEIDEVKEVTHAILVLCNNFMQNGEKHKLFLLCCLIQQGMDVAMERLMRYGMGFCLFEDSSLAYALDQVHSWLDELKSLSLISEGKDPQHIKMHNIVQDVATSALSQGDNIVHALLDGDTYWHTREFYGNCVAISVMPDGNYDCLNGLELPELQAFFFKGKPSLSLPDRYFCGMRNLKILDISETTFAELPSSIQDLNNLLTLHLEYCDIKSLLYIGNLGKLEVLSLRGSSVKALSEEIGNLTNLRVLDLTCCKNQRSFSVNAVSGLRKLSELYLYDCNVVWMSDAMTVLKCLPLEVLETKIPITRQLPPGSLRFFNLRKFRILIGEEQSTSMEQFSSFSRVLAISSYGGKLEEADLIDLLQWTDFLLIKKVGGLCNGVSDLYIPGYLHLKNLYIGMCNGMESVLDARNLSMIQKDVFPELQVLTLENMANLKSICRWQPHHTFFPKLKELRLRGLSQLHPHVLPFQFAAKLRVIEVSDCPGLLYIFPIAEILGTDGDDQSLELPYLEKLELSGLGSLLAIQDPSNPRHFLFNNKIKFSLLKEMRLVNLDEIENLWDSSTSNECGAEFLYLQSLIIDALPRIKQVWGMVPCGRCPCFRNLKCLTVSRCENLETLFPSLGVISLLQLEELTVKKCGTLKEVIANDAEDDANPATKIMFPKLRTLKLENLRSLQCFYRGRFLLEFPMLRHLDLSHIQEMKTFTEPVISNAQSEARLFTREIDFSSLEHLRVCNMRGIKFLEGLEDTTIFPNLSSLTLEHLPNLEYVPHINSKKLRFMYLDGISFLKVLFSVWSTNIYSVPLILSQGLEELTLSRCYWLKELVDEKSEDAKLLPPLRKLKLLHVVQLENVPWNFLRNLRSFIIHGVYNLTSLMSSTLLVGGNVLHQLEYIEVVDCDSLEAIISKEMRDDVDLFKYGITLFPCLRNIKLDRLCKLKSFSLGSYEAHFPSLETVEISLCRCLQSFSPGTLRMPRLKYVKVDHKLVQRDTFEDLNALLAELGDSVRREQAIYQAAEEKVLQNAEAEAWPAISKKMSRAVTSEVYRAAEALLVVDAQVQQAAAQLRAAVALRVARAKALHATREAGLSAVKETTRVAKNASQAAIEAPDLGLHKKRFLF